MLNNVVEPVLVSLDSKVFLYILLFLIELVLVETSKNFIRVSFLLLNQAIHLSFSSLVVCDRVACWFKILSFGGRAS